VRGRAVRVGAAIGAIALVVVGCGGAPAPPEPDLEVGLTEMAVFAAAEVPAGRSVWRVANDGDAHHNLTVCAGGIDTCDGPNLVQDVLVKEPTARDPDALPDETDALVLGSGWTSTVAVDLAPGTYRLWCAVPNHAARGMQTLLEVR
jgi:uncharacterized cupredoxin-like copper-binding protein